MVATAVAIHGTTGTVILDRAGYEVYDLKDRKTAEFTVSGRAATSSSDLVGADSMTDYHFANMIDAIRTGAPLHQPVTQGNVTVTMMQLANVSYFTGRGLHLETANGAIRNDREAEAMTRRTYEKGWNRRCSGRARTLTRQQRRAGIRTQGERLMMLNKHADLLVYEKDIRQNILLRQDYVHAG